MFNIGDKVYYISKESQLRSDVIFVVSYVTGYYISISDLKELRKTTNSIPLWEDKDFINITYFRKIKINKIKSIISKNKKKYIK